MNNLPSLSPACLFRARSAAHKAFVHALLLTSLLLSLFLMLPVSAEERPLTENQTAVNRAATEDLLNPEYDSHIYLPIVAKPPFVITGGSIKLHTGDNIRAKGLTIFNKNDAILDFSEIHFSLPKTSITIEICGLGCNEYEYGNSIPISNIQTIINANVGANHITVAFWYGQASIPVNFTFFYIPNGDFQNASLDSPWQTSAIWTATPPDSPAQPYPPEIISGSGKLRLSPLVMGANPLPECNQAHRSSALASLAMIVPPHSEYKLKVIGTVYTQDQNPSNTATYDAFEIAINGQMVYRRSNHQPPISCANPIYRQVPVEAVIPLNGYAGEIVLSLENHLRYDRYFYTYTEIDMVWIDQ